MWLRNVFLRTLRDCRVAILGWSLGMGFMITVQMTAVTDVASTPAQRAALAALAESFRWNADPVAVTTVGGYVTWKMGVFMLLVAVWPLLAATRTLRGEEDRGQMDALLALPRSRVRVAVEKFAAICAALLVIGVIIGVIVWTAGQANKAGIGFGGALLFGANLAVFCMLMAALGLLIAQFTPERGPAAGWTGGLLAIFIVVDMLHRVFPGTEWLSRLSPVYWYMLNKPLISGYPFDPAGFIVMAVLAGVFAAGAIRIFATRDVGGVLALPRWLTPPEAARRPRREPAADRSLRSVYMRSLGSLRVAAIWWTIGIACGGGFLVLVVKQMGDQIAKLFADGPPWLALWLGKVGGTEARTALNEALLSALFIILPLLLMAFAVTQVNRWAADEEEGRLDMVLATPHSRRGVLLARFGALATVTVIISVVTTLVTLLGARGGGVALSAANLTEASLGMIPLAVLMAGLGYLGAGWLRTAADTSLLSLVLVAWFLITFVGPGLNWSDSTLRLSAFYYYGTPVINGLPRLDTVTLVAVAVILLGGAVLRFARKDVGR